MVMRRKHNRVQVGISQPYAAVRSVDGMTDVFTDTVPVGPVGSPARRYRGGRAGAVALVLSALLSQELGAASGGTTRVNDFVA
jgi:hypothetical protein